MSRGADAAVGMMDTAYFVGRGELLDFFNDLLGLQLTKIEQTASGAVACQLTEYIYPGSIPMSKVNWEAKSDYEFIGNYKLLQAAFNKHNIKRYVDVNKLIRAKYQDNLEFCQWLKAFYDQSGAFREDYDAAAVRSRGKGGKRYNDFLNKTAKKHGSKPLPAGRRPGSSPTKAAPTTRMTTRTTTTVSRLTATRPASSTTTVATKSAARPAAPAGAAMSAADKAKLEEATAKTKELTQENADLSQKVLDLEINVVELEKERDFYFKKLRDVEFMLQIRQDKGLDGVDVNNVVGDIFRVLYATADEEIGVDEDGEVVDPNAPATTADATDIANVAPVSSGDEDLLINEPEEF